MFKRIDKLQISLPQPSKPDPEAAGVVQELLGGRFGEMSTLNNYMFQSFNFRSKKKLRPFYELIASITAEELGHVELVSNTINLNLNGSVGNGNTNPDETPLREALGIPNMFQFLLGGQNSVAADSAGKPWSGDNVFSSGNLVNDLLHNFYLECGARTHKMRVYQMTDNETARELCGYLLVRGSVHAVAYAKALEKVTGVDVQKMLPVPDLDNSKFDHARKFEEEGSHLKLYRFSDQDYGLLNRIWTGPTPIGPPGELEVVDGTPEGGEIPDLEHIPEEFAPGFDEEQFRELSKRLQYEAGM
ncbi:manganese catalase family protein [Salipaludibacillus aurantiacus]|uniref:Mn-containing catalase (Includes spore coat protein CotJC) n=1 Tax=Salipaludibacillus aurantiacus TaxID=1601833 RepID=A0A1H9V0S9_9BACI|nr:manganese catalase family protein [Salipaludibacillus aurantiacus]SES14887.1 Mn-containing catalase (includes spore coat protein CotJC) [Salipaludibacillus aurantiacus]